MGEVNRPTLAIMGMICGYAYHIKTEAALQFSEEGIPIPPPGQHLGGNVFDADGPETPPNLDGERWFRWYQDNNYEMPPVVCRTVHGILAPILETRDGTVGRYGRDYHFRADEDIDV